MEIPYQIVGVLNVTPDSYFDGGRYVSIDAAVLRAGELLQSGADILEVGGESTGPGSIDVSSEEELQRVLPVIHSIIEEYPQANISVDTYKAEVARQAIDAGAMMINDVTAGRGDPNLFKVVAQSDALLVLMFAKDATARTTVADARYENVILNIIAFLRERKAAAIAAGVSADRIIIDPGLGHFISSDPQYSFQVIAQLAKLYELECPVFISPSRKSFLSGDEHLPVNDRLAGTIAASVIALMNGAFFIRTHDVLPVKRALSIAEAILQQQIG